MYSSMPCSNVKKLSKPSLFVKSIIGTTDDGLDSWSRPQLLTMTSLSLLGSINYSYIDLLK